MNSLLQTIFLKIADKMGLTLKEKKIDDLDYYDVSDISITSAISGRLATVVLLDSDINVAGENMRADAINEVIQEMEETQLKTGVEVTFGTGDCIIKPYTDGNRIGYNIVPSNEFYITEAIGRHIKDCLIKCDEIKKKSITYIRIERHHLERAGDVPVLIITQMAFKDGNSIPVESVPEWEDIQPEVVIPNCENMIFGRMKCPTVNRKCLNAKNGVPVTYGMDKVLKNSKSLYDQFNKEYKDKESMIFADKTLFTKDENGKRTIPRNKPFMKVRGGVDGAQLIHEYSPDIRDDSLMNGIEENFKMLELLAGLSSGILTPPTTNFATATEMKASLQMSFAFIQTMRKEIENAIDDLVDGTNIIMNLNNITPMGNYETIYNWSDSYIQDMAARLLALTSGQAIGAITKAEVRAFIQNEPLDIAEEKVKEIKEEDTGMILDE